MSRKSEFFGACKPDDWYIFRHEDDVYDWDEIVNAFIAGGLYADEHPANPWLPFGKDDVWMTKVVDFGTYEACNAEDGNAVILGGSELIRRMFENPKLFTHFRRFEYPF